MQVRHPTDPQVGYMVKLLEQRVTPGLDSSEIHELEDVVRIVDESTRDLYTVKDASRLIGWLTTLPWRPRAGKVDHQALPVGVYVDPSDGSIYKVQDNKAKTRKYAKVWTDFSGTRLTVDSEVKSGKWDYVPGTIRHVRPEWKMTLEQAKKFILTFGQCVRCGRTLVAAESVERGIGPVCVKYFSEPFLPEAPMVTEADATILGGE